MDEIEYSILNNGYIRNDQLERKWLVSQLLRHEHDFDRYYIKNKPYAYEWRTAAQEIKVISLLDDRESASRCRFFNKRVIAEMAAHYKSSVNDAAENDHRVKSILDRLSSAENRKYKQIYSDIIHFMKIAPMPAKTPKSFAWKNAFKGSGAYNMMEYMIKFENSYMPDDEKHDIFTSLLTLEAKVNDCNGLYSSLYSYTKDFIKYNEINLFEQHP